MIPAQELDPEIISMAILLPSADSRVVVSYKQKYVHEVLVNRLVKLAKEKCPDMTLAVDWDVKNQTKQSLIIDIILNSNSDKLQPCLSPVVTLNHSV